MVILSVFGGVAVLLAAIGLHGVIAQGVAERRQEIGVRVALGATRGEVLRLFLRHGLAALLTVVTLLACYMPARSATRIDPSKALRSE